MKPMECILVRYGEIGLKSKPVRRSFESTLVNNISSALKKGHYKAKIRRTHGRIFLETTDRKALKALEKVFGIVSFSPCFSTETGIEKISELAMKIAKEFKGSFAVNTRRQASYPLSSQQVNEKIGDKICSLGFKVDLSSPDNTLFIEIREKAYLYTEKIPGPGGLPVGSQGKVLSLIPNKEGVSSSIQAMKRGCLPILIFTDKTLEKHRKEIEEWSPSELRHYTENPEKIKEIAEKEKTHVLFTPEKDPEKIEKEKDLLILTPLISD
jgi:thiamine biosynthesis protein ThiI